MDGLDVEAADEAASHAILTWMERGYSSGPLAIPAAVDSASAGGLPYVPARERRTRRRWKKVRRGPAASWEQTGRKDHRAVMRSRIAGRRVVEAAAGHGGLMVVFLGAEE